jgi:hypothetical protein
MVKSSIPNWRRANGPISTRSLSRLRKTSARNNFSSPVAAISDRRTHSTNTAAIGMSATVRDRRYKHFRREKGAWWSPRSSKPLPARSASWGRFDSYPLRHVIANCRLSIAKSAKNTRCAFPLCHSERSEAESRNLSLLFVVRILTCPYCLHD